jgi:hypothetical protein
MSSIAKDEFVVCCRMYKFVGYELGGSLVERINCCGSVATRNYDSTDDVEVIELFL